MIFVAVLGLLLGAAAVLLVEQWLGDELGDRPRAGARLTPRRRLHTSGLLAPPPSSRRPLS